MAIGRIAFKRHMSLGCLLASLAVAGPIEAMAQVIDAAAPATSEAKPPSAAKPTRLPRHPKIAPGEELPDDWLATDPLKDRLIERLATVETLLDVLEKKRVWNSVDKNKAQGQIKKANQSTVRMDSNGGGPVRWTKFYGPKAENFYIADGNGSVKQMKRPPQFDRIFKAQEKIRSDASKQIDELISKRQDLDVYRRRWEVEQIRLWCEIAFHNIVRGHLEERPIYRFEPIPLRDAPNATKNTATMRVTVVLMNQVLKIVADAKKNEGKSLPPIAPTIKTARLDMVDEWRRQGIELSDVAGLVLEPEEFEDLDPRDQFVVLAYRLEDLAHNIDDTYPRAILHAQSPADSNLDDPYATWHQLAKSLEGFSQVVLTMNTTADALAEQWQVGPDPNTKLILTELVPPTPVSAVTIPLAPPVPSSDISSFDLARLRVIAIHQPGRGKGKKRSKGQVTRHAVTHENGVVYIDRYNGSKTPLLMQGDTLSWKNPNGRPMSISIPRKMTDNGHAVDLVFGD